MIPWIRLSNPDAAYLYYKTYAETEQDMIFFPNYEHYYFFGTIISFHSNNEAIMNIGVYGSCDKPLLNFIFHAFVDMVERRNLKLVTWGSMFKYNKYTNMLKKLGGISWQDRGNETNYTLFTHIATPYLYKAWERGLYKTEPFTEETRALNYAHLRIKLQK